MRAAEFIFEAPKNVELIQKIKNLWDEGWKQKEIAELLNLSIASIEHYLGRYYPDRPGKTYAYAYALNDNDAKEIIRRWVEGESSEKIASDYSITAGYVLKLVKQAIGDENFKSEVKKRKFGIKYTSQEDIQKMADMYKSGIGPTRIAPIMKLDQRLIDRYLKALPNYQDLKTEYLSNKDKKISGGPTTTKIYRAGSIGNAGRKGTSSRHTQGVQWR